MPTSPGTVASNVRAELARRGLPQRTVASTLGISQQALSTRLTGRSRFTIDEVIAIADLLGVSITTLVAGAEAVSA